MTPSHWIWIPRISDEICDVRHEREAEYVVESPGRSRLLTRLSSGNMHRIRDLEE